MGNAIQLHTSPTLVFECTYDETDPEYMESIRRLFFNFVMNENDSQNKRRMDVADNSMSMKKEETFEYRRSEHWFLNENEDFSYEFVDANESSLSDMYSLDDAVCDDYEWLRMNALNKIKQCLLPPSLVSKYRVQGDREKYMAVFVKFDNNRYLYCGMCTSLVFRSKDIAFGDLTMISAHSTTNVFDIPKTVQRRRGFTASRSSSSSMSGGSGFDAQMIACTMPLESVHTHILS